MAKRKRRTSAKQRAAARRNIKKAQRAARRGHRRPKHRAREAHRRSKRGKKRSHRRGKRRGAREAPHQIRRTRKGRFTARKRAGKHRTRLVGRIAGEGRRRRRHHRRGALENPVGGWEILIGIGTGSAGFVLSDLLDRWLVSRARTGADGKTALGMRWNTAPLTDDLLVRGGAGVAMAAVPLIGAHFIRSPGWRAALQFFGFGAAFRLVGKAADDLGTYLLRNGKASADGPAMGRRIYGTELNSRKAIAVEEGLPADYYGTAGLGAAPCTGCGRADGLGGMCCKRNLAPSSQTAPQRGQPAQPPAPTAPPVFAPPETTTVPATPRIPTSNIPVPGQVPQSPIPGLPAPSPAAPSMFGPGAAGLGDAVAALRAYPDAYRAIHSNAAALAAVQNNTATQRQREIADRVTTQHGEGIRALSAVEQRQPGSIQAARGMAGLSDVEPIRKFQGSSKWSRDDAAE
jgi:hypothetical protein